MRVRLAADVFTLVFWIVVPGAAAAVLFFGNGDPEEELHWTRVPGIHSTACTPSLESIRRRDTQPITIPAGIVQIGDDAGPADELPTFRYSSVAFSMDRTPVTVAQFSAFVAATCYETDAERFGYGGVLDQKSGTWIQQRGADWRHPRGPKGPAAATDHPVTQVSWYDASAFCNAYEARLPTEFEWERAARMGQTPDGQVFKGLTGMAAERVSRGSSFLCSPSFCEGYRASARNHTTPDTSLENIGFRCVMDLPFQS